MAPVLAIAILTSIGFLRLLQHNDSGANAAFERSLMIKERALGPDHVQVGFTLLTIAMLTHKQGHYAAAEPLYRRALAILQNKLGPEHERTAFLEGSMGKLYLAQGRNTEAEVLLEKAIPVLEDAGAPDEAILVVALNDLAEAYQRHNSMIDLFARRSKVASRAIGIADALTPVQVRVFSDCEMRWFYEHLLAVPDPPTASMALDGAIRAAIITNFRHKLDCREDLQTEAVVDLFRRAWQKQQQAASFCDDEHPDRIGGIGEELVRIYMIRAAPPIQPVAIEQQTMRVVLASVRIQAQLDILDEDGMIIAINTARNAPSTIEPMHRFELTTCYRLAGGASGVVRSDTLVNSESPQCVSQVWEINEADVQLTDALYPVAQEAMRRGYYASTKSATRHLALRTSLCMSWRVEPRL